MVDQNEAPGHQRWFLPKSEVGTLVDYLAGEGYTVIAPTIRDGMISMQPIRDAAQMARGVKDEHAAGRYRLVEGDKELFFQYIVGADGLKRYFFPPKQKLFTMSINGERFELKDTGPAPPKLAFIGARPCELAAMAVQDRVFGAEAQQDTFRCESETYYTQTREQAVIIAVNCTRPGGTCFCASSGSGPEVAEQQQYDLALTELRVGFVVRVGSERGKDIVAKLPVRVPATAELELEELHLLRAQERMGRTMDPKVARDLLDRTIEHPHWDQVADRCLSCANCTMVCPTCFCSTVTDSNDLATGDVTRTRFWESCYTHQFSYTTSGPTRNTIRARYRHWLRHKLSTWWDQFDCSGCVGCGRCITWCPVGIDITREVAAIRESERSAAKLAGLSAGSHGSHMEVRS